MEGLKAEVGEVVDESQTAEPFAKWMPHVRVLGCLVVRVGILVMVPA